MSRVVVSPYKERHEEGYFSVRSLTYNDGLPIPDERRALRFPISRFVAEVDGEVAGVVNVLDMTSTRGPALLRTGGVAGVAVSPDRRREGVGQAMMDWLPGHLRQTGVPLASLYPFRETFYAKSGYAVVGKRLRISVPMHRLPRTDTNLPIRRLTPNDWALLHPCHEAFAYAHSGTHVRSEPMWRRVLGENKPLTIYAAGDPVEGYVAVSHATEFWVEQWLSEVCWSTPRGYEACLSLMRQIGINKSAVAWYEASDSPYYSQFLDQGVEVAVERAVMFRVCDVQRALESLSSTETGVFRLRVIDPQVPENEGPWNVEFDPAGVRVSPADASDLTMDIRAFSQAFMGEPSLDDLIRQGRVEVESPETASQASRLLTPISVLCSDFF